MKKELAMKVNKKWLKNKSRKLISKIENAKNKQKKVNKWIYKKLKKKELPKHSKSIRRGEMIKKNKKIYKKKRI